MAMVEAVLKPDSPYRRHGFVARWREKQELAWMDNGGGDEYSIVFSSAGVYIRGFDHTSPLSPYVGDGQPWPGIFDDVPEVFRAYTRDPEFGLDDIAHVTACLWREAADSQWRTGDVDFDTTSTVPDGAKWLFGFLTDTDTDSSPEHFGEWAAQYYDMPVDPAAVRHVFALRPLTPDVVSALNPEVTLDALADNIASIGYPRGDGRDT
ncbi:hypothetical protein [Streptomyces sp. NPDC055749]